MVEDERKTVFGGSHGRMLELSQQTVVGGRRMSKPYVPYGIKRCRYRYRQLGHHSCHTEQREKPLDVINRQCKTSYACQVHYFKNFHVTITMKFYAFVHTNS